MTKADFDFLSCDWGTSSFRLRWVSGSGRNIVREIREAAGVKALYEEATRGGATNEANRATLFAGFLRAKLEALFTNEDRPTRPLPLVISGMASSSIGWRELPYAKMPFPLDGSALYSEELSWSKPDGVGPTYLISGIANEYEMMRGEETEILGLMSAPELASLRKRCLLVLPGTHSKHVWIENEQVVALQTFMTGELFEVLGRQSLLRASVDVNAAHGSELFGGAGRAAFKEGVLCARERGLAGGLFRVRTRAVLGRVPLPENTWFFSGLLIGAELDHIGRNGRVVLAATGRLSELYALALETIEVPALTYRCGFVNRM